MRIHLIAIGGSAMHNLAIALYINHHTVSGSDDEIYNPARDRLESHGLLPKEMGWKAERIQKDLDLIILGMHARPDNPELLRAQELGLPIVSYPEYLYQHAKDKKRVVIAGSHGKTTTTAMILHVLKYWKVDFDFMVGAQLEGFDNMVRLSDAPIMIIEGDEYLSSPIDRRPKFLHYRPHLAIITGIAWDHINVFPTFESYREQFANFCDQLSAGDRLFYYQHDEELQAIAAQPREGVMAQSYEVFPHRVEEGQTVLLQEDGQTTPLQIFGQHNLENLQAAYLVLQEIGIQSEQFYEAISHFAGAAKRQEKIFESEQAIGFIDFAHAPSKVRATITALKEQYPQRELIAFLELHTFSSLNKKFLPQYRHAMEMADRAFVFYSPHTLEMKKLPAISKEEVKAAFDKKGLEVISEKEKIEQLLRETEWADRNLLLMSSGTFGGLKIRELFGS